MTTYNVTVEREGRWWVFTVPELDVVGQAKSLAEVDAEATGVIAAWLEIDPSEVAVNVSLTGLETLIKEWTDALSAEVQAREAQAAAAHSRSVVVKSLRNAGFTEADTGRVLGISKQRVHQIATR